MQQWGSVGVGKCRSGEVQEWGSEEGGECGSGVSGLIE